MCDAEGDVDVEWRFCCRAGRAALLAEVVKLVGDTAGAFLSHQRT